MLWWMLDEHIPLPRIGYGSLGMAYVITEPQTHEPDHLPLDTSTTWEPPDPFWWHDPDDYDFEWSPHGNP